MGLDHLTWNDPHTNRTEFAFKSNQRQSSNVGFQTLSAKQQHSGFYEQILLIWYIGNIVISTFGKHIMACPCICRVLVSSHVHTNSLVCY